MTPMPTLTPMTPQTAALINKGLAALAIAAFLGAAATILPGFGPSTAANASSISAKADRLKVAAADPACAEQNWPNFNASCLREPAKLAVKVRHVTTDRL